jgi:prevent-host-death family protein
MTTLTSRQFHQDSARIKRAVKDGPVVITDRGKPSLVVLTYEAYETMKNPKQPPKFVSVLDALYDPASAHFDFEIPISQERPTDADIF